MTDERLSVESINVDTVRLPLSLPLPYLCTVYVVMERSSNINVNALCKIGLKLTNLKFWAMFPVNS